MIPPSAIQARAQRIDDSVVEDFIESGGKPKSTDFYPFAYGSVKQHLAWIECELAAALESAGDAPVPCTPLGQRLSILHATVKRVLATAPWRDMPRAVPQVGPLEPSHVS
jgi:hypothetical protein